MPLKPIQIGVILNLDCFCRICLYRNYVNAVWVAFLTLTSQLFPHFFCHAKNYLETRRPRIQLSMVNSMPMIRLAHLAAGLVHVKAMIMQ